MASSKAVGSQPNALLVVTPGEAPDTTPYHDIVAKCNGSSMAKEA